MATATIARSRVPATMSGEAFVAFIEKRPHGERWQLIDGDVVMMMNPPRLRHQRVVGNLAMLLNIHFAQASTGLFAFQAVGVMVPGVQRFRARPDLAVISNSVDPATIWCESFQLVAEVRSESNSRRQIERKRNRYVQHPENLYVLALEQDRAQIEIRARTL